ncbi:MAG: alanine/glycine:cation symporter family protein [Crocinitomicaceae bacterium]|jgi:AGCS family alanine or glycine:cation symporter|nr:alanine/glycine:cation symporter family protein [Crocinitomicaceae bacterium]MDG1735679.1 alanine/glycine:cation symporter family protein [Crocinitomicaceae bacterium]
MKKGLFALIALLMPIVTFAQEDMGLDQKIDQAFKPISDFISGIIFFEVFDGAPFVIILLVCSALFFTLYFGFPNIRFFGKAINVVRGKYDHVDHASSGDSKLAIDGDIKDTIADESKEGEVTHFQALATAVSGTVGNGNIAGVALAIALGGPGATFWMVVCGLLGMSSKFVECTLGVQYRDIGEDGTVYGGPMYYLSKGLKEKGFALLGKITAVLFAIFCIGGSFGGGNAAQSNQATIVLKELMGWDSTSAGAIIGVVLAILVGIIIIGGIKRIASVTEKVVPFMAVLYLAACLYIILTNFSLVDDAFSLIFREAFNPQAIGVGGVIGVLLVGFKRAAFSNEAGAGSASIAHSAVKTKYSASEGLVALLEPFIDTVVICTMTALVIIIYNFGGAFEYGGEGSVMIDGVAYEGAGITSKAFGQYIPYSNVFLTVAVVLFAVSTMISWSYYGLQSWKFLFGRGKAADLAYKFLFLGFVVIGAAASMDSIWGFSDAMIFAMVFPNMVGLFFLFPIVKKELSRYLSAIKGSKS